MQVTPSASLDGSNKTIEPYVGPRSFRRDDEDQKRFFGRDDETDEIVSLISAHKLVLVYAQSGAGKTSIFNAQVIPTLENLGFEVLCVARVQVTTSTISNNLKYDDNTKLPLSQQVKIDNPYIFNAIQSLKPNIGSKLLANKSLTEFLSDYFPNHIDDNGEVIPQVLIFDQLEELFSFSAKKWKEHQEAFFKQISQALNNNSSLRIAFIIREDHLAELDPFQSLLPEKLRPRFRLERLREEAAVLAIKGPLEKTTKVFNDINRSKIEDEIRKLVKNLIKVHVEDPSGSGSHQMEGEFVEPIHLQIVCQRWWREQLSPSLGNVLFGRDTSDFGDVDKALENFYVDCIHEAAKLTGISEDSIREWCEKKLITSSETRGLVHLDSRQAGEMPSNAIDVLVDRYLIRREWRAGAPWYELTHDRLIKPIKDSNKAWRYKHEEERAKALAETSERIQHKYFKLKIVLYTIIIAIAIVGAYYLGTQWVGYGIGQFEQPQGVAVDSSGNVYVADTGNDRIQKFSSDGNFINMWGTTGNGAGQFKYPQGVAVDSSGNVYVADPGNDRISEFDSYGDLIKDWGNVTGNGAGHGATVYWKVGVAVDSSGNVYVADPGNDRIQKFSSDGTITKWGTPGNGTGQLVRPQGVAVDSSGNVYVADSGNDRILEFDS